MNSRLFRKIPGKFYSPWYQCFSGSFQGNKISSKNPYQFVHVEKTDQNFICIVWKGKTFIAFADISEVSQTPLKDTIIREGILQFLLNQQREIYQQRKMVALSIKKGEREMQKPMKRSHCNEILSRWYWFFLSSTLPVCYNRKIRTIYFLFGKFFAHPTS